MSEFRFFVFTCRKPEVDFRLGLVAALRADFEVWYIQLKKIPIVTGPHAHDTARSMPFIRLLGLLRKQARDGKIPVYFNSTNTIYPYVTALLRLAAPRGVWCLDMHDDLQYPHEGVRRVRRWLAIRVMYRCSDLTLIAAPNLTELFPGAKHLGNAAEVGLLPRPGVDRRDILILSSIDRRFDFELVSRILAVCPQLRFQIHGQVAASVRAQLEELVAAHANVRYHGPYTSVDLPGLLARYAVSFAPYVQAARQTRYLDPLRFHHCLNSGMEVISTDIPAAHWHGNALHIIHDEREFAALFTGSGELRNSRQGNHAAVTWSQRAGRLIDILRSDPRVQRLRDRV